jgi:hypothetical protein
MKTISLNVSSVAYKKFQEIAQRQGLPVSELVRRAMDEFIDRNYRQRISIRNISTIRAGKILKPWKGGDIFKEMVKR